MQSLKKRSNGKIFFLSSSLDDSASLAEFFSFVENEIHQGKFVSEISASQKVTNIMIIFKDANN